MPSLAVLSKIEPDFSKKRGFKIEVILTKHVLLNSYSSMKKIKKIQVIFDEENYLWKSKFCTLQQFGKVDKASWNTYNQGGWLISSHLLKNWIAKGIASEVN